MLADFVEQYPKIEMDEMFRFLSRMCREGLSPVVVIINEVDSAGDNQVFVKFLAQLRAYYLDRYQT